jgi:CheY-like chemotaxis protein
LTKRSILYVEDDDAAALLVQIALEEFDASVQCYRVSDVDHALEFLSTADGVLPPSLILLDLNLPRKSGFEVLATVRQSKSFDDIPVVVFTSSAALTDKNKSLALGAKAYIRKPSTFDEYLSALRDVIKMIPEEQTRPRES